MGTVCARCSDVKKSKSDSAPGKHPDIEESDADEESSEDNRSEVAASSEDEENQEDYKQDVEDILTTTGKNLKRGKTMAMKEAITTAKKHGVDSSKVSEAEKMLDEHKKQQRRDEVEKEVDAYFASEVSRDIKICEKLLKKSQEADCRKEVIERMQTHLDELIVTRPLEEEEVDTCRDYIRQSCREFVMAATKEGGRSMIMVRDGRKVPALLTLDPALQNMFLKLQDVSDPRGSQEASVSSLQVYTPSMLLGKRLDGGTPGSPKRGSEADKREKSFRDIEEDDKETALAIKFDRDGVMEEDRIWCFVEPTPLLRDRLFEAIYLLTVACKS